MPDVKRPTSEVVQLSGADADGKPILSVVCKRTYDVLPDGQTALSRQQLPLVLDFEPDPENPRRFHRDCDTYPYKPLTDVVVRGHAYGAGRPSFVATVRVGAFEKQIAVIGDRRCTMDATGRIIFSDPEAIERVPLRYDRAYGGLDQVAHDKHGNPLAALNKYLDPAVDISLSSPYLYPRNHVGVGYLVEATPRSVEKLVLPNLEDPTDRLSPERLVVGSPLRWPLMPLPQSFDWVDPGTFPRLSYIGIVHDHEPLGRPLTEVARGFVPADILEVKSVEQRASPRFANGASLGLQLPYLVGGEQCLLANVHPRQPVWMFRLPEDRPSVQTDGRNGTMKATRPVIQTVEIEPDESRLSIVWRGSAPALRPYGPEELKTMPLDVRWT